MSFWILNLKKPTKNNVLIHHDASLHRFFLPKKKLRTIIDLPKKKVGRTTENALLSKIVIEGKDMD